MSAFFRKHYRHRDYVIRPMSQDVVYQGSGDVKALPFFGVSLKDFRQNAAKAFDLNPKSCVLWDSFCNEIKTDGQFQAVDHAIAVVITEKGRGAASSNRKSISLPISFQPHHHTITKSGAYEYFNSTSHHHAFTYALAELIDNSLGATKDNKGARKISLRAYVEEQAVVVLDNGCGMTAQDIKNWAVMRLSKEARQQSRAISNPPVPGQPYESNNNSTEKEVDDSKRLPRFLNSEISMFGAGGKQSAFFIGTCCHVISKTANRSDVHEFTLSERKFQEREKLGIATYTDSIIRRPVGDTTDCPYPKGSMLYELIADERNYGSSFTLIIITELVENFVVLPIQSCIMEQLSNVYHYYLHGVDGNIQTPGALPKKTTVDIQVENIISRRARSTTKPVHLNELEDHQTKFINSSVGLQNCLEFTVTIAKLGATVEGILRYHPFLYDHETYPHFSDDTDKSATNDARTVAWDSSSISESITSSLLDSPTRASSPDLTSCARGSDKIFVCYWQGRLIPNATVSAFSWLKPSTKSKSPDDRWMNECYGRVSGVLFCGSKLKVTINKMTFMDLDEWLKDPETIFKVVDNSSRPNKERGMEKAFQQWLRKCHETCDKQICFLEHIPPHIRRENYPIKSRVFPWGVYNKIRWGTKEFKKGDRVRILSQRKPGFHGTIVQFYLFAPECDGEVMTTGGEIELEKEPRIFYDEIRCFPLEKLDTNANAVSIEEHIEKEEQRLPRKLVIQWPTASDQIIREDCECFIPPNTKIGRMVIKIMNHRNESISTIPYSQASKKLIVQSELFRLVKKARGGGTKEVLVQTFSATHLGTKHDSYEFLRSDTPAPGSYHIRLSVCIAENVKPREGMQLPTHDLYFSVTEPPPHHFTFPMQNDATGRMIGVPFDLPLEFRQENNQLALPITGLTPKIYTKDNALTFEYKKCVIEGENLHITDIVAKGTVSDIRGQSFAVSVNIPELARPTESIKMRFVPGYITAIVLSSSTIDVLNLEKPKFSVSSVDICGNTASAIDPATSKHPPKTVLAQCKLTPPEQSKKYILPSYTADLTKTGTAEFCGEPLHIPGTSWDAGFETINASVSINGLKSIAPVPCTFRVHASNCPTYIQVFSGKHPVQIQPEGTIRLGAGSELKTICFRVFDEANRRVDISEELAAKIKPTWTPSDMTQEELVNLLSKGNLPSLTVAEKATDKRKYEILFTDGSEIHFFFFIEPQARQVKQMTVTAASGERVAFGSAPSLKLHVTYSDMHGNPCTQTKLLEKMKSGLKLFYDHEPNPEPIKVTPVVMDGFLELTNFHFPDKNLGPVLFIVECTNQLQSRLTIEIVPGAPHHVELIGQYVDSQVVDVVNKQRIPSDIHVQVSDYYKNPIREAGILVSILNKRDLTIEPNATKKTNASGQVNFGKPKFTVTNPPGNHVIFFAMKSTPGQKEDPSVRAKLTLNITPDPQEPDSIVAHRKNNSYQSYTAGEAMDLEFLVKVLNMSGEVISGISHLSVSMHFWQGVSDTPPVASRPTKPSPHCDTDEEGVFYFRNLTAPEEAGVWKIIFCYRDGRDTTRKLRVSSCEQLNVVAGKPVKLCEVGNSDQGFRSVSNTPSTPGANVIVKDLQIELLDKYGNKVKQGADDKLEISVVNTEENYGLISPNEIPRLTREAQKEVSSLNGFFHLKNIALQSNTVGKDGAQFILRCTYKSSTNQECALPPLDFPFYFSNDHEKQALLSSLQPKRNTLNRKITDLANAQQAERSNSLRLKGNLDQLRGVENQCRQVAQRNGLSVIDIKTPQQIHEFLQRLQQERDAVFNQPRRVPRMPPYRVKHPEILGRVIYLAQIPDENESRVISWHIGSDLDSVVVRHHELATKLYKDDPNTGFYSLDTMSHHNVPTGQRWHGSQLPHMRIPELRNKVMDGNPVFARCLLTFPAEHMEACQIVFYNLLGDTLLIDTMQQGNSYRHAIVSNKGFCPAILTRQGERISGKGKIGGRNSAMPRNFRDYFGAPPSTASRDIVNRIEVANQLAMAIQDRCEAESAFHKSEAIIRSPNFVKRDHDLQTSRDELMKIDSEIFRLTSPNTPNSAQKQHASINKRQLDTPTTSYRDARPPPKRRK